MNAHYPLTTVRNYALIPMARLIAPVIPDLPWMMTDSPAYPVGKNLSYKNRNTFHR